MAVPSRAYDCLYDKSYTVSGARDHFREQSRTGGFLLDRVPDYNNFFSELVHHPSQTLRFKAGDKVPAFVDRNYYEESKHQLDLASRSNPVKVAGTERFKYFKRPMLAAQSATSVPVKMAPVRAVKAEPAPPEEPRSRTIATQSDYRESEAQTDAYDPEYVIPEPLLKQQHLSEKYNCDGPELLALADMRFGQGLPPGLVEVLHVEKLRAKRAFEATLPSIDDLERLPLRQRMIEEWEKGEWAEREAEILGLQEERLALLSQAIQVREEEIEASASSRVNNMKTLALAERAGKFAYVQTRRIKAMRHFMEARKYVEKPRKLHKPTIVEQYANYHSSVYAPPQREGRFPETKPIGKDIVTEGFEPTTLQGVIDLEAALPARLLNPKISTPAPPAKLDYKQRQQQALRSDLDHLSELLGSAKSEHGRGYGDVWPAPIGDSEEGGKLMGTVRHATDRPPTPEAPPLPSDRTLVESVVMLQRLLRGRAVQNMMWEGKERRLHLIKELQLQEAPVDLPRPEDTTSASVRMADRWLGQVISTTLRMLAAGPDSADRRTLLEQLAKGEYADNKIVAFLLGMEGSDAGAPLPSAATAKSPAPTSGSELASSTVDPGDISRSLELPAPTSAAEPEPTDAGEPGAASAEAQEPSPQEGEHADEATDAGEPAAESPEAQEPLPQEGEHADEATAEGQAGDLSEEHPAGAEDDGAMDVEQAPGDEGEQPPSDALEEGAASQAEGDGEEREGIPGGLDGAENAQEGAEAASSEAAGTGEADMAGDAQGEPEEQGQESMQGAEHAEAAEAGGSTEEGEATGDPEAHASADDTDGGPDATEEANASDPSGAADVAEEATAEKPAAGSVEEPAPEAEEFDAADAGEQEGEDGAADDGQEATAAAADWDIAADGLAADEAGGSDQLAVETQEAGSNDLPAGDGTDGAVDDEETVPAQGSLTDGAIDGEQGEGGSGEAPIDSAEPELDQ